MPFGSNGRGRRVVAPRRRGLNNGSGCESAARVVSSSAPRASASRAAPAASQSL